MNKFSKTKQWLPYIFIIFVHVAVSDDKTMQEICGGTKQKTLKGNYTAQGINL